MKECRFLIPSQETGINYSKIVTEYLNLIKLDLGKTTGRMWFTGRNQTFVSSPMGKNTISKVVGEVATFLGLDGAEGYTFHSLRRTSASCAADQGASAVQMQSHFGWKSPQMAMEYVTKSKTAIKDVAALLSKGEEDGDHKEDVREGNGQKEVTIDAPSNYPDIPNMAGNRSSPSSGDARIFNIYGGTFYGNIYQ